MRRTRMLACVALALVCPGVGFGAETVPTDVQQPGTQPLEVGNLESPNKCDNCHGGYDSTVEPAHNWRGSMMANAGRDPIFWATLAIAEQDFDGAGDLCIRCHSTGGWLAGRSTPTDGSALAAGDGDGVECDFCHKMTNPDDSEWQGEQFAPFLANDLGDPGSDPNDVIGYYGTGMSSVWDGNDKLGPYHDAEARHQFIQSQFHRSVDFCGTCHDVSNPVVGNLAHNFGAQLTEGIVADGTLGGPVDGKAAFNNFPYQYGVVERTFSEYKAGMISQTRVSDYLTLPEDLQAGALETAYESALVAGQGGDYADGTPRYFSCQTCHMRPVTGLGCNKNGVPVRADLPLHDMTGGNYWMPEAIQYLDSLNKLRLGGGLSSGQIAALNDGIPRAHQQLLEAASLELSGDTLRIINLTGHKLISGYPEGRRMWVNVKWYDAQDALLREDGAYGPIGASVANPAGGPDVEVESLLDLQDPNTTIFEAHMGMTREWALQLVALGYPIDLPLGYDRMTGQVSLNLGQLATGQQDEHETFHFVLNNTVIHDNRVPPYGMSYDTARLRNALPVPASQYGDPGPGGTYEYWAQIDLAPPAGAVWAAIELLYQPTSWEYIQFLWLANNGQNAFLADEGVNMLDAWLNAGGPEVRMARPYVMASTVWGDAPVPCTVDADCDDGAFCNGAEVCSAGTCDAGTPPDCSDGVSCTDDTCIEATDSCDSTPNDGNCDNGLFCDGAETCDAVDDCQAGTPPDCDDGVGCTDDSCNESTDSCDNAPNDGNCDDGVFCDGAETCDAVDDCQAGTPPSCDDGVGCTDDSCNLVTDVCDNIANDANCDDGAFCNGAETCDAVNDCQAGSDPCSGQSCDEEADICVPSGSEEVWMSFRSVTAIPGVGSVADDDFVSYNPTTGTWTFQFDGSDVGLAPAEIDGLAILPDGDLLLSVGSELTLGGLIVDDSDVVRFTPTSLGANTAGTFSMYFDGSDVGLTERGEDVDAIALAADGRLIVSSVGRFDGNGAFGQDEDLFIFTGTLGPDTSGSFARHFDGSLVGLSGSGARDVDAAAFTLAGVLALSIIADSTVDGIATADEDILDFTGTFGASTSGSFSMRLDLSALGIASNEDVGSLHIAE